MKKVLLVLFFIFICGVSFAQEKTEEQITADEKVFVDVEQQAGPIEGLPKFHAKFANNFRMPRVEEKSGQVRVMLTFIVEKDGSFSDIKILRNPGYGIGEEAVRVLKLMAKWKAATQDGKAVRSKFTLPITIQVQ